MLGVSIAAGVSSVFKYGGLWTAASVSGTVLAINCVHGGFKAFRSDPHDIDNNRAFATCVTLMFLLVG